MNERTGSESVVCYLVFIQIFGSHGYILESGLWIFRNYGYWSKNSPDNCSGLFLPLITAQHWFKSVWISHITYFHQYPVQNSRFFGEGLMKGQVAKWTKIQASLPHFLKENVLGSFATLPYEKASNQVAQWMKVQRKSTLLLKWTYTRKLHHGWKSP